MTAVIEATGVNQRNAGLEDGDAPVQRLTDSNLRVETGLLSIPQPFDISGQVSRASRVSWIRFGVNAPATDVRVE